MDAIGPDGAGRIVMAEVVGFGQITLQLAGGHAKRPGAGRVEEYQWWQARGFDATFPLLDTQGQPAAEGGTLSFLIHRRPRPLFRPSHLAEDRAGIEAARAQAAESEDDAFYQVAVEAPGASSAASPVRFHEERAVLWWPVGIQQMATFRITAWFDAASGRLVFAEQDIDLFWEDVRAAEDEQHQLSSS